MEIKEEKMCRICLKPPIEDFEIIEETTENMFRALSLEINLSISQEPVMCKLCAECLRKCFDFKSSYMCVEDRVASFSSSRGGVVVDLTELYLSGSTDTDGIINSGYSICRFCLQCLNKGRCTSLEVLNENLARARGKLAVYVSEMDLRVTKDPVICLTCLESFETYEAFRMKIWDTEERIKQYCEAKGIDNSDRLKLSNAAQFFLEWTLNDENGDCVRKEATEKKVEEEKNETDNIISDAMRTEIELAIKKEENENSSGRSDYERYSPSDVACQTLATKSMSRMSYAYYKCNDCPFETYKKFNYQRHIRTHLPKHKPPGPVVLFKCDFCRFETHRKFNYERHVRRHKLITQINSFNCEFCDYKTKDKSLLNRHLLIHKGESETTVYRCVFCLYKSKRTDELTQHMRIHKTSSDAALHECALCAYKTKQKHYLGPNASAKTVYKCKVCAYETRFSCHLTQHNLMHKNKSNVKLFKCDKCTYESKQSSNLKRHLRVHTGESSKVGVVNMCEICGYGTRQKSNLKRHMQTHQK